MASKPIFIFHPALWKKWQEEKTGIKGKGRKSREAQMKSEPGGKDLVAPSTVGHRSSWPRLRGLCDKRPGQGVGLGLYPQPSYPGACYHLPVALLSSPPFTGSGSPPASGTSRMLPLPPGASMARPYLALRNESKGRPRPQVKRKISFFYAALERDEPAGLFPGTQWKAPRPCR